MQKFLKKQIQKTNFLITKNLKKSVISVFKDIKLNRKVNCTVLFSPGAASFDQFKNFEIRGNKFKELCKFYAKIYLSLSLKIIGGILIKYFFGFLILFFLGLFSHFLQHQV